jgi:hypothetical protein
VHISTTWSAPRCRCSLHHTSVSPAASSSPAHSLKPRVLSEEISRLASALAACRSPYQNTRLVQRRCFHHSPARVSWPFLTFATTKSLPVRAEHYRTRSGGERHLLVVGIGSNQIHAALDYDLLLTN